MNLTGQSVPDLLRLHHELIEELRHRGILRSSNNPVADYTEWLVATRLDLTLLGNSASGHDAVDPAGYRFQIKGRRLTPQNPSTQLSQMRRLDEGPFDFLLAVVYNPDFTVAYAGKVPLEVVRERSRYSAHTNAYILQMKRAVLDDPRVEDVTSQLVP